MESETSGPGAYALPRALVRFPDAMAAARTVAGMTVAGRIAAEAADAGISELEIDIGGGRLPEPVRAEVERVSKGRLRLVSGGVAGLVLSPDAAIDGALLRRFLDSGRRRLRSNGWTVAELTGRGEGEFSAGGGIVDLKDGAEARRQILLATAKSSDGIISAWLNRPISQRLSSFALRIPAIPPSHLSLVTAAVLVLMFFLLLRGGHDSLIFGGVLFHVASVFDGCDGEIARATHRTSAAGARLDTFVDVAGNLL